MLGYTGGVKDGRGGAGKLIYPGSGLVSRAGSGLAKRGCADLLPVQRNADF